MGKTVVAHFFDSWCKFTWLVIAKRVICCDVVYGSQNDTGCDGEAGYVLMHRSLRVRTVI